MKNPIKIGMEVEANWPTNVPFDVHQAFGNYNWTTALVGATRDTARWAGQVPEKYWVPEGWLAGSDPTSGMEMKFHGPTQDLEVAKKRVVDLVKWFKELNINSFGSSGTHIHLGVMDWLAARFGPDQLDPVYSRARNAFFSYFVTREPAIRMLIPRGRRETTSYGRGFFYNNLDPKVNNIPLLKTTPIWAIQNAFFHLNYASTGGVGRNCGLPGDSIMNGRHFHTFEFRLFPGIGDKTALLGYLRLIHHMFMQAAPSIEDGSALPAKTADSKTILTVNPLTFTVQDLIKELTDPWVKKWAEETAANNGNPLGHDIEETTAMPERIAV